MRKIAILPHDDTADRAAAAERLGALPEWDLGDLYDAPDAPALSADLETLASDAKAFEADYKGTLAERLARPDGGATLAAALRRFEVLEDTMGKIGSYAGCSTPPTPPTRSLPRPMATCRTS
ncbi:MAG: hypothetical protein AcusKO_13600 [Acuticoccus sp.]